MFARLLLLFILLPLADLILIFMMIRVHWMLTVLWILVSGLAGAWYVRRQGTRVVREARAALTENRVPADMLVEGCLVLIAGGLLITPGLITDLIGLSMLVRPGRRWYRNRFIAWFKQKFQVFPVPARRSDVLDGEVVEKSMDSSGSQGRDATGPEFRSVKASP